MTHQRVAPIAMGLLLVLVGLVVGMGGVWLMALGGSWYYLPAGLLLVLTGLLLLQGNPAALPTHAVLLSLTLAWSLWESGLNAGALAARGNVLWMLGLVMATPWFLRGLEGPLPRAARRGLGAALSVFAAVGLAALLQPATAKPARFGLRTAFADVTPLTAEPRPTARSQPLSARIPAGMACPGALRESAGNAQSQAAGSTPVRGPGCAVTQAEDGGHPVGPSPSQRLTGADMSGLTLLDHLACRIAFERIRFNARFARSMAPGQRLLQTPPLASAHPLVKHAPSALMYTAQITSTRSAAETTDALARPIEDSTAAQPAPTRPASLQVTDGGPAAPLKPLVSPIGLPCLAPSRALQGAMASGETVTAPAPRPRLRTDPPMAAAQVSDSAAL
jgi:glucose dehydrogenase